MAVQTATGTLSLTTGAIGTTFTVSGLAFQPLAIIFFQSGRTAVGQGEGDSKMGVGFAIGTTSRCAYATQNDHGTASMQTDMGWRDDACIATISTAGAFDGLVDLDAITSDGFRLIVDDVLPQALEVGWHAIGGSDITSVAITHFTEPGATGNQDINTGQALNTGANDKALFVIGGPSPASGTTEVYATLTAGIAAGDTISQAVCHFSDTDGPTTSVTHSYCRSGDFIAHGYDDLITSRATVSAWLSTGFRLNWAEVDAGFAARYSVLSILGGRYEVGNFLSSTGTTNQTEATAVQPTGLLLLSSARAESTSDTVSAHAEFIIGAASSSTQRACAAMTAKDASGNADVGVAQYSDQMYASQDVAATIAIDGLMDLVSFDSTPGFTYVMDNADATQNFVAYLAFGSAPGAGFDAALIAAIDVRTPRLGKSFRVAASGLTPPDLINQ